MGLNEFNFILNDQFLSEFKFSPVNQGFIEVNLKLIKSENMYDLKFDFKGTVKLPCDTCAEDLDLPIKQKFGMMMKLSEENNFDDIEIMYLARTEISYDLTQYLYESLLLAIPQRKSCDGFPEPKPCNEQVLKRLTKVEYIEEEDEEMDDDGGNDDEGGGEDDPRWNKLKDLLN